MGSVLSRFHSWSWRLPSAFLIRIIFLAKVLKMAINLFLYNKWLNRY